MIFVNFYIPLCLTHTRVATVVNNPLCLFMLLFFFYNLNKIFDIRRKGLTVSTVTVGFTMIAARMTTGARVHQEVEVGSDTCDVGGRSRMSQH